MIEQLITYMKARLNITRDDEGAALVEYGLLVALIAVVCIAGVTALGVNIQAKFAQIAAAI